VRQFEAEIIENRPVAESWRELLLAWDEEAGEPSPGQFVTLRASPYSDPLLRRPFALSGYAKAGGGLPARTSIVYQIRGGATRLISELSPGARLDLIGPLGSGFPLPALGERPGETQGVSPGAKQRVSPGATQRVSPVLAGGGIGLGPLLFLASALAAGVAAGAAYEAPRLVLGVRSASLLPSIELPPGTVLCTDDGSSGFEGTPVDWLSRNAPGRTRLYGCGPTPMLAALAALAAGRGWPASLSAEQWMACGVGACMGCALPATGGGYLRACADGPVFDAAAIDWKSA
jgi:dihydroorotate dehydrogenase electron transfer subunit